MAWFRKILRGTVGWLWACRGRRWAPGKVICHCQVGKGSITLREQTRLPCSSLAPAAQSWWKLDRRGPGQAAQGLWTFSDGEEVWGVGKRQGKPWVYLLWREKREGWLLNVIYPLWFSYSKYSHMLMHAEPPTFISLQDGTHTRAGGDTEAPFVLRMEKSRAHLAIEGHPMRASLRLPPSAEVQPAARFSTQAVPPDSPSHLRNTFAKHLPAF